MDKPFAVSTLKTVLAMRKYQQSCALATANR